MLLGTIIHVYNLQFVAPEILTSPWQIAVILGDIIPRQATFFVNLVITCAIRESVLRLWSPWRLIGELIAIACCAVAPREYKKVYKPERFNWAEAYSGTCCAGCSIVY